MMFLICFSLLLVSASSEDFASFEARLSSMEKRLQKMEAFSGTLQAPRAAFGPQFLGEDLFAITSEKEYPFDIQTLNFFTARLPSRQQAKKPAVQSFRRQAMHLLVTTDSKGSIQVWNSDQELLQEYDTKIKQAFTASEVHGSNHNVLLLGLESGEVKVYSLAVWREVFEQSESVTAGVVSHLTLPYQSGSESEEETTESEDANEKEKCESSAPVTSIGVYIKRSHQKYLVGYGNGEIHSFDDSGAWKRKWSSGNDTIHKLVVGPRSETLVLTNAGYQMLHSFKLEPTSSFCEPPEGISFVDAVFDAKYPELFYVSTSNGTVYAYRQKAKGCKVYKQINMESTDLARISSMEGHLLVGSANAFNAFNVTSRRLKNIQKAAFRQEFVLKGNVGDVAVNLYSSVDGYGVAGVALQQGNKVSVWEGYIAPSYSQSGGGSGFDLFSFLTGVGRFPIFILIIVCVFGYQWYNRNQRAKAFEDSRRNRRFDPMQFSDYSEPRMMQQGRNLEGLSARTHELDSEIQRLQKAFEMNKKPGMKSKGKRFAPVNLGAAKAAPAMAAKPASGVSAAKAPTNAAKTATSAPTSASKTAVPTNPSSPVPTTAAKAPATPAKAAKSESTI